MDLGIFRNMVGKIVWTGIQLELHYTLPSHTPQSRELDRKWEGSDPRLGGGSDPRLGGMDLGIFRHMVGKR